MSRLTDFIIVQRKWLFSIALIFLCLGGIILPLPQLNGSLSGFELQNNESFQNLNRLNDLFGEQSSVYLQIIPSNDDLDEIRKDSRELTQKIRSEYPNAQISSPFDYLKYLELGGADERMGLTAYLEKMAQLPVIQKLVANDRKSCLMVVSLDDGANIDVNFFNQLVSIELAGIESMRIMSSAHLQDAIEKHIGGDIVLVVSFILGFFILFISLVFRDWRVFLFCAFVIMAPVGVSLWLFGLLGIDVSLIGLMVFPIVLILSLSDALHLLAGYISQAGENSIARATCVVNRYIVPSFYSSATTSVAFLSFYIFNESKYIQEFGLITALALMIEFLLAFALSPYLLVWLNPSKIYEAKIYSVSYFFSDNKKWISYSLLGISLISLLFIPELTVRSDAEVFFPKNSQIRETHDEFRENFYSSITLNVLIESLNDSNDEEYIDYLHACTEAFRASPDVRFVVSPVDRVPLQSRFGLPVDLFKLLGTKNPYQISELGVSRIELSFKDANDVTVFSNNHFHEVLPPTPPGIKVSQISPSLLIEEVNESVSMSLIKSLAMAGAFIFLMILIMTRSVSASLLGLVPNLIPIGFMILIFYLLKLDINMVSALSAVICIGLLDDDTIHILYRRLRLKEDLKELSFSVLSSGLILSICFGFFLITSFEPIRTFGWVSAMVFIIGVVSELTLMQWVINWITKKYSNDA